VLLVVASDEIKFDAKRNLNLLKTAKEKLNNIGKKVKGLKTMSDALGNSYKNKIINIMYRLSEAVDVLSTH